jgi:hemerythrin
MTILWRDEMSIDGGVIDADHKCLIDIVNDVDVVPPGPAMSSALAVILMRLGAYARVHFEREERLQAAALYTDIDAHHRSHGALLNDLDAIRADSDKPRSLQNMKAFHGRLCHFLHHWLIDHILKADLPMKPFVAEMGRHAQGIVPLGQAVKLSQDRTHP